MRPIGSRIAAILRNWNWKAAVLSGVGRAPIFLLVTVRYGWRAMSLAAAVEFGYRVASAGFFASWIQHLRKPLQHEKMDWRAAFQVTVLIPALCLSLDYLTHLAVGTPNLRTGIEISFIVSSFTSLFNWYSMKRGVLIVGKESKTLFSDLKSLPFMVAGFLMDPPLRLWRFGRQLLQSGAN